MNKDIKISITMETILKVFLLAVGFWLIYTFSSLILIIVTSIILATAFEPLIKLLQKQKIPRIVSVSMVYTIIISLITYIFFFFTPIITDQMEDFASNSSTYTETIDNYINEKKSDEKSFLGKIFKENNITSDIINISNFSSFDDVKKTMGTLASKFSNFMLIMVLSFYFAAQEHGMRKFLNIIVPKKYRKYSIDLWQRAQEKITLWMQGQFILGFIVGIMVYIGLIIINVPQPGLLAIVAGFMELIPVVGQIIAAIPAIIIGFIDGGVSLAIITMSMYVIVQFIEGQIIYPLLVKKLVGVPSIIVIISLIIGAELFGFLGVIVSIPMAAVVMEFIKDTERLQEEDIKKGKINEIDLSKNSC